MSLTIFTMAFSSALLILGAAELTLVHSKMLYAQFGNPANDNSFNQDCSQSAIGKEITQFQECQQQRDTIDNDNDGFTCPVGYYRNSFWVLRPSATIIPITCFKSILGETERDKHQPTYAGDAEVKLSHKDLDKLAKWQAETKKP